MLEEFRPRLYVADGPTVSFYGFPYPTRMAAAKLSDNTLWVWSPVALTEELANAVDAVGPVRQHRFTGLSSHSADRKHQV